MVLFVSSKTMAEQQSVADIGSITELNGVARVVRNEEIPAALKFGMKVTIMSKLLTEEWALL